MLTNVTGSDVKETLRNFEFMIGAHIRRLRDNITTPCFRVYHKSGSGRLGGSGKAIDGNRDMPKCTPESKLACYSTITGGMAQIPQGMAWGIVGRDMLLERTRVAGSKSPRTYKVSESLQLLTMPNLISRQLHRLRFRETWKILTLLSIHSSLHVRDNPRLLHDIPQTRFNFPPDLRSNQRQLILPTHLLSELVPQTRGALDKT
jgi:hypothetical protein